MLYLSFLEKVMAPYSSTLAWKIPWIEEPGGLQSSFLINSFKRFIHIDTYRLSSVDLIAFLYVYVIHFHLRDQSKFIDIARLAQLNKMAGCFFNQVFLLIHTCMRVNRKMCLLVAHVFLTITNKVEMNIFLTCTPKHIWVSLEEKSRSHIARCYEIDYLQPYRVLSDCFLKWL